MILTYSMYYSMCESNELYLVLLVSSSALLYSSASAWSAMLLLNVDQVCVSSPNSRLL